MTRTDVARFTHKSVPVIFEPPCTQDRQCTYNITLKCIRAMTVVPESSKYYIF